MYVNATKPPVLRVTPKGANVTIIGNVDVNVIQKNKTRTNAFILGLVKKFYNFRVFVIKSIASSKDNLY